jgi:hypothetical protein
LENIFITLLELRTRDECSPDRRADIDYYISK